MKNAVGALVLALVVGSFGSSPAQAQGYGYAQTTIENPTNQTLNYSVRWGDGSWVNYSLAPGTYRTHYVAYEDDSHVSPSLAIRFDYTLADYEYVGKEYALVRYAGDYVDRYQSKRYVFRKSADGYYLDLYGVN